MARCDVVPARRLASKQLDLRMIVGLEGLDAKQSIRRSLLLPMCRRLCSCLQCSLCLSVSWSRLCGAPT